MNKRYMQNRPKVFFSYTHKDQMYFDELMVHVKLLSQRYDFEVWSDQKIQSGDSWETEIAAALETADVAILLVSADYLASEWLASNELPSLLKRAEQGEIHIIPVILRPCAWAHTPLAYYQVLPRDAAPISTLSEVDKDKAWVDLYDFLEAQLHSLSEEREVKRIVPTQINPLSISKEIEDTKKRKESKQRKEIETLEPSNDLQFFISHAKEDGDFAENLKGRMKEERLIGWIDIDVLEAGVDWRMEIDEAILKSRALILVLSPDSKMSEYVTYEWAFALGSGLRIVPLMLRDTSIHPRLEVFQYLDFTNRRARPWSKLFSLLHDVSNSNEEPNKANSADVKSRAADSLY